MDERSVAVDEPMALEHYLQRIGLAPEVVDTPNHETLERLHHAHVLAVPFENLSIIGDPHGDYLGEQIELSLPSIYEKIVVNDRGGYCFELNALFHWALEQVGFEAELVAARVLHEGAVTPPANHLAIIVHLDEDYLVDVGLGRKKIRQPLLIPTPSPTTMPNGDWRIVSSDRPDADFLVEHRPPDDTWEPSYRFSRTPRELRYFEPLNEYLQTAPESPFTDHPLIMIETTDGYCSCSGDTLRIVDQSNTREYNLDSESWHDMLARHFGIEFP